jgi:beta-galactosidase
LTGPESPVSAHADASYSGSAARIPGELVDGIMAGDNGWSNVYRKAATPLLPPVSRAHATEWVSLAWDTPVVVDRLVVHLTRSDSTRIPAALTVRYFDGTRLADVPATRTASADGGATVSIAFGAVATNAIRLDMTSAAPGAADGFIAIAELEARGDPLTAPDGGVE